MEVGQGEEGRNGHGLNGSLAVMSHIQFHEELWRKDLVWYGVSFMHGIVLEVLGGYLRHMKACWIFPADGILHTRIKREKISPLFGTSVMYHVSSCHR